MSDHFLLVHGPHGLLHLLQKHLGDAATQRVHRVQKLGLKREKQGLEKILSERILKDKQAEKTETM